MRLQDFFLLYESAPSSSYARLRVWTDNELQARLEQEEIWAQTIWPEGEPVLSELIEAELARRGINV